MDIVDIAGPIRELLAWGRPSPKVNRTSLGKAGGHGDLNFNLFPASPQICHLDEHLFRSGQEAEMNKNEANAAEVQDLSLTDCMMYGTSIILDANPRTLAEHHRCCQTCFSLIRTRRPISTQNSELNGH